MRELNDIKKLIVEMSKLALHVWQETNQAFMEHDLDLLSKILKEEHRLNDLEEEITSKLAALNGLTLKEEKNKALIFADVAEDFELIGDYCKDILERVQIKIEEKLLFSDEAVKEYEELYHKTEAALDEIKCALEKDSLGLVKEVLRKEEHIDSLVDEYRRRHNERLLAGLCTPIACNMYLNMLDFTAAVYYHSKKIARNLLKIK
jgi:phosphate:Na+ symporter